MPLAIGYFEAVMGFCAVFAAAESHEFMRRTGSKICEKVDLFHLLNDFGIDVRHGNSFLSKYVWLWISYRAKICFMGNERRQLIFADDAGDAGFKLGKGSSNCFVIACVIFDDNLVAEEVSLAMKKYRRRIGFSATNEFKFSKTKKSIIKGLLREIRDYDFRVRAICVDKSIVRSHELRSKPNSFYNYVIKEVLANTPSIKDASVRMDGHADREYRRTAVAYFRKHANLNEHKIADFKFYDSKKNELIQLADLIAGSILRFKQADKSDYEEYYNIIRRRIEDLSGLD
jgi:hypothetical protein